MKCIKKLSKAYLSSSKLRRKLVIWSIVLSTILVLSIGNLYVGRIISNTMHYEEKMATYDGYFTNVTQRQIDEVKDNDNVINSSLKTVLTKLADFDNRRFYLENADSEYMDRFNYKIEEGAYPNRENEIALTRSIIEGQDFNIGDYITLNLINKDKSVESKKFILTGIVKARGYDKNKNTGFISQEYIDNANPNELDSVIFVSVKKTFDKISLFNEIAKTSGIDKKNVRYRSGLQNSVEYILVVLLVVILSIITISNIFSYALIERVNTIGLLKAVGMTNKQLRRLFTKEGIYYYINGAFIGIVIGILFNSFSLNSQYKSYYEDKFTLVEYIKTYVSIAFRDNLYLSLLIITLLLEAVGVWLALKIPSKKIKKMSIVDSIHFIDKVKVKRNKMKKRKFNNPALKLAYVNLNNNRFKTVLSVLTISINVVLFLYFTHFFSYAFSDFMVTRGLVGDIQISGIDYDDMIYIDEIEGIERKNIEVRGIGKTPIDEIEIDQSYTEKNEQLQKYKDNNEDADINLYSYNDNMLECRYKYMKTPYTLEELKTMKNWCIVFDVFDEYDYDIGETFIINNQEIRVVGEISLYHYTKYITPPLLISKNFTNDAFNKNELGYSLVGLNIEKDRYDDVKNKIVEKFQYDEEVYTTYIDVELKKLYQNKANAFVMINSFIGMIAMISLCMLVNIMYTSIVNRKREFGMLRAIGMTKKQFNKYLVFEGNILISFITIISIPAGYFITKLSFDDFSSIPENSEFIFKFPYWCLIIIPIYYIIIRLIIKMSLKRMDKESVVDLIRWI
ncbi:ABC transporter permease [Vallitalea maricola]|uniref:ABC transporter permease n=1 Tax=Vallitalea maricola TaxID=3074433 RepID=A0ACB5UQI3_9FIRM|nr:ABC transporter permease [Vallitalea sp. AN17-2]